MVGREGLASSSKRIFAVMIRPYPIWIPLAESESR